MRVEGRLKSGEMLERCMCTHAEANTIMHCAMLGIGSMEGSVMYSTDMPCLECSKMAVTVGIRRFVCTSTYPEDTQDLVDMAGVQVVMMDPGRLQYWIREMSCATNGQTRRASAAESVRAKTGPGGGLI